MNEGLPEKPTEQWVHLNGKLTPKSEASVSIYDHGFLYGDGAFEGIRVYSGNVFKLEPHLCRLYRSAQALDINLGIDHAQLQNRVVETVRANQLESGYIRLSISRGVGLGLYPRQVAAGASIIIST